LSLAFKGLIDVYTAAGAVNIYTWVLERPYSLARNIQQLFIHDIPNCDWCSQVVKNTLSTECGILVDPTILSYSVVSVVAGNSN
jgi:hypothetical protein